MSATYNTLYQKIARYKKANPQAIIPHPSALALFYIDAFIEKSETVKSTVVYRRGLCKAGQFVSLWREQQREAGFLIWRMEKVGTLLIAKYQPGPKLIKIINDAIFSREELIGRSEFDKLKKEVKTMQKAIDFVIQKIDPPVTDEKREEFLKHPSLYIVE